MSRRVNLIPMAGAGQRFVEAGYATPKPLIDVGGQPMIVRAARSLPEADLWIFVCRSDHVERAQIDQSLQKYFWPCRIVVIDHLTEGQACSCLLAREELHPDDHLNIGACDNSMTWSRRAFTDAMAEPRNDFLVWTFRRNPVVLQNPRMYGWVQTDSGGDIAAVSVKVPISPAPMDDHAVIGTFSFRRAGVFLEACDDMIRANARINREFYIDHAINFALARAARGRPFEVERYIGWGTPRDLENYNFWREYFRTAGLD